MEEYNGCSVPQYTAYPLLIPIGGGGDLAQKMSVQFLTLEEAPLALMRCVLPKRRLCS